jgi:hypothetical protein
MWAPGVQEGSGPPSGRRRVRETTPSAVRVRAATVRAVGAGGSRSFMMVRLREEAGCEVAGFGDAGAVAVQGDGGLYRIGARRDVSLTAGGWFHGSTFSPLFSRGCVRVPRTLPPCTFRLGGRVCGVYRAVGLGQDGREALCQDQKSPVSEQSRKL